MERIEELRSKEGIIVSKKVKTQAEVYEDKVKKLAVTGIGREKSRQSESKYESLREVVKVRATRRVENRVIKLWEPCQEWRDYEEKKRQKESKPEIEFVLKKLRETKGKGYNSQRLEIILECSYLESEWYETLDFVSNFFKYEERFDLKDRYKLLKDNIEWLFDVSRVGTEENRVLLN